MADRTNTPKANWGKIYFEGMGNFLCPPIHPEHTYSIKSVYGNTFYMSLSSAIDANWLNDEVRQEAKQYLDDWNPLRIDHKDVKAWIYQVLGYFRNCYKGKGENPWNVANLRIRPKTDPMRFITWILHAGVHLIRQYYPTYKPSDNDFVMAQWGA